MSQLATANVAGRPLRVVIDSNMLESDELRVLLSISPENRAVLTDYAWIEAYKQDAVTSIIRRLSVLREYPTQVIVLKGTRDIAALDARAPGIAQRMAWPRAERELAATFEALRQAKAGDRRVIDQILAHGEAAEAQMSALLSGVPDILGAFPEMQDQLFTQAELEHCRRGAPYTRAMIDKILSATRQMTGLLYQSHPAKPRRPSRNSLVNSFLYRYGLASILYFMRWIRVGSPKGKRHENVRNDFVDLHFAVAGTYFNGLMTNDKRAFGIHGELRFVLEKLNARVPEDYVQPFLSQFRKDGAFGQT